MAMPAILFEKNKKLRPSEEISVLSNCISRGARAQ